MPVEKLSPQLKIFALKRTLTWIKSRSAVDDYLTGLCASIYRANRHKIRLKDIEELKSMKPAELHGLFWFPLDDEHATLRMWMIIVAIEQIKAKIKKNVQKRTRSVR